VAQRVTASIRVQRFGLAFDPAQRRLDFPHADVEAFDGQSGKIKYTASDLQFEGLRAQLERGQWQATSASAGSVRIADEGGRFELNVGRVEFPRGLLATRAVAAGVELLTPHASFNDVTVVLRGPFRRTPPPPPPVPIAASTAETQPMTTIAPPAAAAAPPTPVPPDAPKPLRQERLRFLDGVSGDIKLTLRVKLDLPVIGSRTLDQTLRIPIKDGGLDFRALEKGLDWLEGAFLDISLEKNRLVVSYGVPIVLPSREIISWSLDQDALTLAKFDRVPLRSLADFRIAKRKGGDKDKRASRLEAFSMEAIDIKLSLLAPRSLEVGTGAILFGGDDAPGIVDLSIAGSLAAPGPGSLKGSIALLDTTIKDLHMGGAAMTVDRLHLGAIDDLVVTFEGFQPMEITARIDRATATNLALVLGPRPDRPAP
jgi:hypothetical protein